MANSPPTITSRQNAAIAVASTAVSRRTSFRRSAIPPRSRARVARGARMLHRPIVNGLDISTILMHAAKNPVAPTPSEQPIRDIVLQRQRELAQGFDRGGKP